MNASATVGRAFYLMSRCAWIYSAIHVLSVVVVGGSIGLSLAYALVFHVARNIRQLYKNGTPWVNIPVYGFPTALAYFLCAPKRPERPRLWPGVAGAAWLLLGGFTGWAAGGPALVDPLLAYPAILLGSAFAGGALGAVYGSLLGRFEIYALQRRIGPAGAFRANLHACALLLSFAVQMCFIRPSPHIFNGAFGPAWVAESEGTSYDPRKGGRPADRILRIPFGADAGKVAFGQFWTAAIAQPFDGVQIQYRWADEDTPQLTVAFTGALPNANPTSGIALPLSAGDTEWRSAFVPFAQQPLESLLLTSVVVKKPKSARGGLLEIRSISLSRKGVHSGLDSSPMAIEAPVVEKHQPDPPRTGSAPDPTVSIDHWRGVREWIVPCLILVWGLGYGMGLLSVRSERRSADFYRHADLYAAILNTVLLLGLFGVLTGRTMGRPNIVGNSFFMFVALGAGTSTAYLRERFR